MRNWIIALLAGGLIAACDSDTTPSEDDGVATPAPAEGTGQTGDGADASSLEDAAKDAEAKIREDAKKAADDVKATAEKAAEDVEKAAEDAEKSLKKTTDRIRKEAEKAAEGDGTDGS